MQSRSSRKTEFRDKSPGVSYSEAVGERLHRAILDHYPTSSMTPSWRITVLILCCTIALLVTAYWSTAQSMAEQWFTLTYSHTGLIVPISLYLVWRIRGDLVPLLPRP